MTQQSNTQQWFQIRQARHDLSDYVIHWVRGREVDGVWQEPFQVLKQIIACGYLTPSFALRYRYTTSDTVATIRGTIPAVCFSELPLGAFVESHRVLPDRYVPYGVIIHKWHLFTYGGRPVIYGDQGILDRLNDDDKYLWVRYSPIPVQELGGYPVDWTHEREWRAVAYPYTISGLGACPEDSVPLLLPPVTYPASQKPVLAFPRFFVRTRAEQANLRALINALSYTGNNEIIAKYYEHLPQMAIIPIESIQEALAAGRTEFSSLETVPLSEIDPTVALPTPESFI